VQMIARMRKNGIEPKRVRIVHSNGTSGGIFVLAEGVKGAGEETQIMPPLFIYRKDGRYAEEVEEILNGSFLSRSGSL